MFWRICVFIFNQMESGQRKKWEREERWNGTEREMGGLEWGLKLQKHLPFSFDLVTCETHPPFPPDSTSVCVCGGASSVCVWRVCACCVYSMCECVCLRERECSVSGCIWGECVSYPWVECVECKHHIYVCVCVCVREQDWLLFGSLDVSVIVNFYIQGNLIACHMCFMGTKAIMWIKVG